MPVVRVVSKVARWSAVLCAVGHEELGGEPLDGDERLALSGEDLARGRRAGRVGLLSFDRGAARDDRGRALVDAVPGRAEDGTAAARRPELADIDSRISFSTP